MVGNISFHNSKHIISKHPVKWLATVHSAMIKPSAWLGSLPDPCSSSRNHDKPTTTDAMTCPNTWWLKPWLNCWRWLWYLVNLWFRALPALIDAACHPCLLGLRGRNLDLVNHKHEFGSHPFAWKSISLEMPSRSSPRTSLLCPINPFPPTRRTQTIYSHEAEVSRGTIGCQDRITSYLFHVISLNFAVACMYNCICACGCNTKPMCGHVWSANGVDWCHGSSTTLLQYVYRSWDQMARETTHHGRPPSPWKLSSRCKRQRPRIASPELSKW